MKLYFVCISFLIFLHNFHKVKSMECYVCNKQEGNNDKCIKTSMQCLENEESCLTTITYETPPYWLYIMERRHFIQKSCIPTDKCRQIRNEVAKSCYREYYMDWKCAECCEGELCNYYVTLSGRPIQLHKLILMGLTLISTLAVISH